MKKHIKCTSFLQAPWPHSPYGVTRVWQFVGSEDFVKYGAVFESIEAMLRWLQRGQIELEVLGVEKYGDYRSAPTILGYKSWV